MKRNISEVLIYQMHAVCSTSSLTGAICTPHCKAKVRLSTPKCIQSTFREWVFNKHPNYGVTKHPTFNSGMHRTVIGILLLHSFKK